MKILAYAILAILFMTAVLGQSTTVTAEDTTLSPTAESTVTITAESTTATTAVPTTAEPTTITTSEPTSTSDPTTISPPPPTTTSTSAPTTIVSSTTSEAPTTKAPQPTPPTPEECGWNVTQNNVTCIRAELKAYFTIPVKDRMEYILLSQNASDTESNCSLSNDTQKLVLSEPNSYTLTMIFVKEDNKVYVNETTLEYITPEGNGFVSGYSKMYAVKAGNSYLCKSDNSLKLGNVTMEVHQIHLQAFGGDGNTNFGSAEECEADDKVSDAVPIAVGCALAALIIIVLIAYLVGRRRSRQRGYQSV